MFLIRQITDPAHAANRKVLAEAQAILREQFPALSANEIECLPDSLARPFKHGFHPLFFVAEDDRRGLRGFALLKEDADEDGGDGFNRNFPLKEGLDGAAYRKVLKRALRQLKRFGPDYLVLAFGVDTAKADPTGSFGLLAHDFEANGRMIAELELPTLIVQEGGYRTRTLGINARHFFQGLTAGQP